MPEFTLTSTAFESGGSIPARFTCDGDDVSPDIAWAGAPADASAFALVLDDPDADGFLHWAVLDFESAESGALPAGFSESVDAPQQATNDFGRIGYGGPCPPGGTHRYVFRLYALDTRLNLEPGATRDQVLHAMKGHVLAEGRLTGTYSR